MHSLENLCLCAEYRYFDYDAYNAVYGNPANVASDEASPVPLGFESCIVDALTAVEATHERWFEAEVYRVAGEIVLKWPEPDAAKAKAYFERALAGEAWELRAAMSMARLSRHQGKRRWAQLEQARGLLDLGFFQPQSIRFH